MIFLIYKYFFKNKNGWRLRLGNSHILLPVHEVSIHSQKPPFMIVLEVYHRNLSSCWARVHDRVAFGL